MDAKKLLARAGEIITGERLETYGAPENNFARIAQLWSAYMGISFTAHDVAVLMALLKVARIKTGVQHEDSYVDACGYVALAAAIQREPHA